MAAEVGAKLWHMSGCELGSFFFPLYESASNIPKALAFGRIAGAHAAGLMPWE